MIRKESSRFARLRPAFSLIDMLVVIAIIAILIGLIVPAVLQGVESARRASCQNNLRQMGMALHGYVDAKGRYPPAWIGPDPEGWLMNPSWGWAAMLLPFLDEESLYQNAGVGRLVLGGGTIPAPANSWTQTELAVFRCPSDPGPPLNNFACFHAASNYRAVAGPGYGNMMEYGLDWGGVIFPNSKVAFTDITDGLSNTIVVGECRFDEQVNNRGAIWAGFLGGPCPLPDLNWILGQYTVLGFGMGVSGFTNINLPGDPDSFSSVHFGGASFAFCDGSVRFLRQDIDPEILIQLSWRNDGAPVNLPDD